MSPRAVRDSRPGGRRPGRRARGRPRRREAHPSSRARPRCLAQRAGLQLPPSGPSATLPPPFDLRSASMPAMTMVQALQDALRIALREDPRVVVLGEDVGKAGGVFRVTEGLQAEFGEDRVVDTPLAENGIIGGGGGMGTLVRPPAPA